MKYRSLKLYAHILLLAFMTCLAPDHLFSQTRTDSVYLPPIKITSLNGYGPFVIGSERSNLFIIYQLPTNTSEVIMKMIDSKGLQIGHSYTKTGSNLQTASWSFESDTMGFPLSPQLSVEVHYQNDSIAVYRIPYTVYPDTVSLHAGEGFGPFVTNNYQFSDTLWHPVPELFNTFTIKHLPPRTDTIEFQIMTLDSTIVHSFNVIAPTGTYLDSAVYPNVRMDNLPLDTKYLRTLIWCQGGPERGLEFHRELNMIPQKPRLVCVSDDQTLYDSIGVFVQNQFSGQALLVDSVKHALIQNGPGTWDLDNSINTIYKGPYSIDIMQSSFSVEAWMKFNITGLTAEVKGMNIMTVDSAWQVYIEANTAGVLIGFTSLADDYPNDLWTVNVSLDELGVETWHHLAFTCYYDNTGNYPEGKFYLDGLRLPNVNFDSENYDYISEYLDWRKYLVTKPLRLGGNEPESNSLVTAMDDVRIWARTLSEDDILNNYWESPLQEYSMAGYWDFDDLRNRLNYISDKSYHNNFGYLKNNASFIPQYPAVQRAIDTIKVLSSDILTDSVRYIFIDRNNVIIDSCTQVSVAGKTSQVFDLASLPYTISKLKIIEFYKSSTIAGLETDYDLQALAPEPIATPQYNWNTYYSNPADMGKTYAPVIVSGLPDNTRKVLLGLKNGNDVYDTMSFTSSSIPFHHSLTLNGQNNYIKTSQNISSPSTFSIMFWVKTTTGTGGKIIGFTDTQSGLSDGSHDREIIMEDDGSLRFNLLSNGSLNTLYALNINNDGDWHHVAATFDNNKVASIYVDGSLAQRKTLSSIDNYQGWWIVGRNSGSGIPREETVSAYFMGSLSEISIWNRALDCDEINSYRYKPSDLSGRVLYYKLDEGTGTVVHDNAGSDNGTIMGDTPVWLLSNTLSYVAWNENMVDKQPGTYTFFSKIFYPDGPSDGADYSLGNFMIDDPFPDYLFNFCLSEGQGYFNQGIALNNTLSFKTEYSGSGQPNWVRDYVKYNFLSSDHELISYDSVTYTGVPFTGQFEIDMGDAPPGSYISLETGYLTSTGLEIFENSVSIPIYIHPMIPPKVNGNFGPFDQAIAPGCMQHSNTFSIAMEPFSDMDSIRVVFNDAGGDLIGRCSATKINDTLWTVTYDMSLLSPPVTNMNLEYFLGNNPHPAATEGPYPITIHKTRPAWFDFITDGGFSNVQQSGNTVTFKVTTSLEKNWQVNNIMDVTVPEWVPLLGGTKSTMFAPSVTVSLQYDIAGYKLSVTQSPQFSQEFVQLGFGSHNKLEFNFGSSQNSFFDIDDHNNLIATQNFKIGGAISADVLQIENLVSAIGKIVDMSETLDPASILVKPSFKLTVKTSYEYASRLHMMVDSVSGLWGSYGSLDIDADSTHVPAFQNSASYHFYSGTFGIEFSIGAKILEGLASGNFGVDSRVGIGYGHSYITIPSQDTKPMKSALFQVYGRFYIDCLWGWYERDIWGPTMFYSTNFWGDDLSDCFPPINKKSLEPGKMTIGSTWPELSDEIYPVNWFTKMPLPSPNQTIASSEINKIFTWVETGRQYGEKGVKIACLPNDTKKFSNNIRIEFNNHALNGPVSDAVNDNLVFLSWAQTRYDNHSILAIKPTDVLKAFFNAQDIWYAIYDISADSVLQMAMIDDDTKSIASGRAEANPAVVAISETRTMIIWQVADLENHTSAIWYVILEKQGDQWDITQPAILDDLDGVKTQLSAACPETDMVILSWMNTTGREQTENRLFTSVFDGVKWNEPEGLVGLEENQTCNYIDMNFNGGFGAVVLTLFETGPDGMQYEKLRLLPWNVSDKRWSREKTTDLMVDSISHLQLPRIAIDQNGKTTIAVKVEKIVEKSIGEKISQIDLLTGDLNDPSGTWMHIPGNEFVCDTAKQVNEIALSYIDNDTLMILTNEFPMLASNPAFEPLNGVMFGNPEMNLVLRCFAIDENGTIKDINENNYFVGIDDPQSPAHPPVLLQNYPNPCREFTIVKFELLNRSHTTLELFDIKGIHIATLIDQDIPPGSYEMKLNTSLLKPGIYLCRLTNGQRVDDIKISVIN